MAPRVEVLADADAAAGHAAAFVAAQARSAVAERGRFSLAVSGGRTPWTMLAHLVVQDMPWTQTAIYQVDERVAPAGDPDRNITHVLANLPPESGAEIHPMPVEEDDLEAAAIAYASELPARLDLVHLGLGRDGHTASLFRGDRVLDVTDREVSVTGTYRGRARMTLTYPTIARARRVLWLVTGRDKADALRRLLAGDRSTPAGRVAATRAVVVADAAAAGA